MTIVRIFVLYLFVLSVPFWAAGALVHVQLVPGLPVSALATFCPMFAALMAVYRERGAEGVRQLLWRTYRGIPNKTWYVPALVIMPAITVVMYELMRLSGTALPPARLSVVGTVLMVGGFFVAATGEEIGWSGYAIDRLQARWSAVEAAALLGVLWVVVHIVPLLQAHRSLSWIAWWSLGTVSLRVVLTWIYNNTGNSVFAAILFHDTINVSWQLFPDRGSHWDPRIHALLVVAVAAMVTIVWGPRTLAGRASSTPDVLF